mgnify:CR=1 FL=1
MALYAIGDLHLSLGMNKPMDVFGPKWANYVERIRENFSKLNDDDVIVIAGDISWGMSLEQSLPDFQFIDALPGRKILLKGNHDYWWGTASKMKKFFAEHDITTLDILYNNAFFYGGHAICGTRGWFYEEARGEAHDRKIMLREVGRLETSLKAARARARCSRARRCGLKRRSRRRRGSPSTAFCTIRPSIRATSVPRCSSFSTNTRSSAAITGICTATRTAARSRGCAKKPNMR